MPQRKCYLKVHNCAFESLTLAAERTNSANSVAANLGLFSHTHTLFLDEIFHFVFFSAQLKNLHFLAIRLLRDAAFRVNCFIFSYKSSSSSTLKLFQLFFFSLHSLTYSILQASWFHVFQPNFAHELAYLCKLSLEAVKMSEYLISAPSRMRFWLVFMEFRGFSSFSSLHFTPSAFLPYSSVVRMGEFPTTNQTNAIENRPFWEIFDAVLVNFGDRRQRRHLSRDCNYTKWKLFAIYYINSTFALTMKFFSSQVWRFLSHFWLDVTLSVSVQLRWIGWFV